MFLKDFFFFFNPKNHFKILIWANFELNKQNKDLKLKDIGVIPHIFKPKEYWVLGQDFAHKYLNS